MCPPAKFYEIRIAEILSITRTLGHTSSFKPWFYLKKKNLMDREDQYTYKNLIFLCNMIVVKWMFPENIKAFPIF